MSEQANCRFWVTLDPADAYLPAPQALLIPVMALAGFQEVAGLGAELEVMPYPEGGNNGFVHQLPVRHNWGRLTLKRGIVKGLGLWHWYRAGMAQSLGARRSGMIMLLDPAGLPAYTWVFFGGLAVKWTGPTFNAMQSELAFESIEIAHQGIEQAQLFV